MCKVQILLVILCIVVVQLAYTWDIAISVGDRIEFYTDDGSKTDTVHFNSQNLTAIAYDEVHNMLLYIDKQNNIDAICGYNMTSVEYKCYMERIGSNIRSLAFDPVTEKLFFTDTKERSINWFSFYPGSMNNNSGNLLIKMDSAIPTDIAVDSCRGYIYWINTNLSASTIERARFDGSEREIIFNSKYKMDLHSLAIDQQTQKMFWYMPTVNVKFEFYSADLNGKNSGPLLALTSGPDDTRLFNHPNTLTVSKNGIVSMVDWCIPCLPRYVWNFSKQSSTYNKLFKVDTQNVIGITANYKTKDQFQGISVCNHIPHDYEINDSFKIAKEYDGSLCVHGIKVRGQSLCKCTPGYTGMRCEVSVCENYCLQGNCSFTEEGLPECSCNAGYSGDRCEVNVCNGYCLKNGTCTLDEEEEPFCECIGDYEGERCEVPINKGDGSLNEKKNSRDQNEITSATSTHNLVGRKVTLANLLANWKRPVATISVVVEVKTKKNND